MKFNNWLALALEVVIIPGLWIVTSLGIATIPDTVLGATISVWTMIAQYYFRKKLTNGGT